MHPTTQNATARGLLASPFANKVLSILPAMLAGAAWLGLAGMALGTGSAFLFTHGRWNEDVWFGLVLGVALGAHCGLWAGLVFALSPREPRALLTTISAGIVNSTGYWAMGLPGGLVSLEDWLFGGSLHLLPFLCGWLFARAMSGNTRLPLIAWARASLVRGRHNDLPTPLRILAGLAALALGYAAVAAATVAVAALGSVLPLAPSDFLRGAD